MDEKLFYYIFLLVIIQTGGKKYYEAIPKETICKVLDSELVYNYTCTDKYVNQTMSLRSQELIFQPGVELSNYHIKIQLFRKFGKIFRPFLINTEQDFCAFTNANSEDASIGIFKKMLNIKGRLKFGNWYYPCPVSGRRYEFNVATDNSRMPDVAITGEHRFDITGFTIVDGIRREFCVAQHFGEIRTKVRNWLK